jgi:hypothetical protein
MVVNLIPVVVATVASIILGMLWYGPLFGKQWMALQGFTKKDMEKAKQKGMGMTYLMMTISSLVTLYILAYFLDMLSVVSMNAAIMPVTLIWLGFFATTMLGSVLWEGKPMALYILNIGFSLVNLIIAAAIITAF